MVLMEILIEKACEADRPRILELLRQANMHRVPSPEMPAFTYENYFVARLDGEIVGFSGYKILAPTEAKTELMVVDKRYRGLGVGFLLQQRRMEDMLSQGVQRLTTNADLPETIAWYQKHFGYREAGTLQKLHEFGDPNIDHWTTLEVDLVAWDASRKDKDTA
jgi:ribosomal-protein-alanine N-acetyltransferase